MFDFHSLPVDVCHYLVVDFYLPFIIAERERKILWDYEEEYINSNDEVKTINFLSNCSKILMMDDRINDGKEETLFNIMSRKHISRNLPNEDVVFIIGNALRVNYLPAFRYMFHQRRHLQVGELGEFLLRQSFRLITDPSYRQYTHKTYISLIQELLEYAISLNLELVVERALIMVPYFYDNPFRILSPIVIPQKQECCNLIEKYDKYIRQFFYLTTTTI